VRDPRQAGDDHAQGHPAGAPNPRGASVNQTPPRPLNNNKTNNQPNPVFLNTTHMRKEKPQSNGNPKNKHKNKCFFFLWLGLEQGACGFVSPFVIAFYYCYCYLLFIIVRLFIILFDCSVLVLWVVGVS
jgi:hypothetical protein